MTCPEHVVEQPELSFDVANALEQTIAALRYINDCRKDAIFNCGSHTPEQTGVPRPVKPEGPLIDHILGLIKDAHIPILY